VEPLADLGAALGAARGISRDHRQRQLRKLGRERGHERARVGALVGEVLEGHGQGGRRREGHATGQRLEERDAEGVDVGEVVDGIAPGLLGAHVGGRPHEHAARGDGALAAPRGQPEVDEDGAAAAQAAGLGASLDEDVSGLQVAVDHAAAVGVIETVAERTEDAHDLVFVEGAAAQHAVEGFAAHELHDVVDETLLAPNPMDVGDVGVAKGGGQEHLGAEALVLPVAPALARVHELDGDLAVQRALQGAIHDAHAAATELIEEVQVVEGVGGELEGPDGRVEGREVGEGELDRVAVQQGMGLGDSAANGSAVGGAVVSRASGPVGHGDSETAPPPRSP
jgi:hypothetical protein